jgi:hypothetical protein
MTLKNDVDDTRNQNTKENVLNIDKQKYQGKMS